MIALIESMSEQRGTEMRQEAASRRRARRAVRANSSHAQMVIRRLDSAGSDRPALERLAGRDSAAAPTGEVIVAERDGHLVAAISLTTGELISDPFVAAGDARALLQQRAVELRRRDRTTRSLRLIRRAATHWRVG